MIWDQNRSKMLKKPREGVLCLVKFIGVVRTSSNILR